MKSMGMHGAWDETGSYYFVNPEGDLQVHITFGPFAV